MKKVIVVAHPDDEILFFSSILERVDTVIVCFGPSNNKSITDGRKLLQNRYPLKNIEWLNLQESNVFLSANWDQPTLTDEGILVHRDQNVYQKNFLILVELFKTKLAAYDEAYTHNPWGEYGHEEHILVLKAVWFAAKTKKIDVYVSSYISDRSKNVFEIQKDLLGSDLVAEKIPKNLCDTIKKLYISNGCWTWDDEYTWPESEVFIKLGSGTSIANSKSWSSTANPPVMFLTRSFKISYLGLLIRRLLPPTLKKNLKKILKRIK